MWKPASAWGKLGTSVASIALGIACVAVVAMGLLYAVFWVFIWIIDSIGTPNPENTRALGQLGVLVIVMIVGGLIGCVTLTIYGFRQLNAWAKQRRSEAGPSAPGPVSDAPGE